MKVWQRGREGSIPNASIWREPWGLYVRLSGLQLTAGPRFGWGFALLPRKLFAYWRWRLHGRPPLDQMVRLSLDGETPEYKLGYLTRRGKVVV